MCVCVQCVRAYGGDGDGGDVCVCACTRICKHVSMCMCDLCVKSVCMYLHCGMCMCVRLSLIHI